MIGKNIEVPVTLRQAVDSDVPAAAVVKDSELPATTGA